MRIAPGLHRVGNDLIAVHLIVEPDGVTLIDAGIAGQYRAVRSELEHIGRSFADVRGIVLTHGDTDHLGFAERLRADLGIPVFVHAADAARARGEQSSSPDWGGAKFGPTARFLAYAATHGGLRTRFLTEVRTMSGGDVLPLPGAPRIIELPGHSPGSVAIHVPSVRSVFVGDALTTRNVLTGATGPRPAPFTDDPAAATAALARLESLEVDRIVPGHGPIADGPVDAVLAAYRSAERTG